MSSTNLGTKIRARRLAVVLFAVLAAPVAVSACSHAAAPTRAPVAPVARASNHATMSASMPPATAGAASSQVREAAWSGRPSYTHASARTEEAYRYALDNPNTLKFLPCYCGCGAMGHGSNLDCYFEPRSNGSIAFEQHASYCGICVDITLKAKQMIAAGSSLPAVRDAIDAQFSGAGPGTDTARPVS